MHEWQKLVRLGCNLGEEWGLKVGVHRLSCPCPVLFITLLESVPRDPYSAGCQWDDLYADDLVIITESPEELQEKLILWELSMARKRLWVNVGKAKVLISSPASDMHQKSSKDPGVSQMSEQIISCAPCKGNLGSNLTWPALPAMHWSGYDLLDGRCYHQGPSELAGPPGEDAAWRSGEVLCTNQLRWYGHVERSAKWLKNSGNLIL